MNDYKGIFTSLVEIVSFLFLAFGGFLTRIAPPDDIGASFSLGIVSFFVLIVLLIITGLGRQARKERYRGRWLIVGCVCLLLSLPAGFFYFQALEQYTYWFPPEEPTERHLKGSDDGLTADARAFINRNPSAFPPAELERNFSSVEQIWHSQSIRKGKMILQLTYAWLVLSLATSIFSLIEANMIGHGDTCTSQVTS